MPTGHSIPTALLISIGGSPEPVAYSIDRHQPEKVVFFASRGSRGEIETKVRPLTTHRWRDQEFITTPDHQDLTACLRVLRDALPHSLEVLGLAPRDLMVDYTGGTKTMSAALVLATVNWPVSYGYVGGRVRTKDGLGVVLDGSEAVVFSPNPWDVLAVDLRRRLARQFNRAHFAEARDTAAEAASRVGDALRPLYEGFVHLCGAYDRWQGFDYTAATGLLKRALAGLEPLVQVAGDARLIEFLRAVRGDLGRLESVSRAFRSGTRGEPPDLVDARALVMDLVVNAERATRLAGRPDDAVARLYSAIEKLAKATLAQHGINNSQARVEQIPERLREEYAARHADPQSGLLRFGLNDSYRLLDALGDTLGARFRARADALEKVLDARNSSLMVHGWNPIKRDHYERMLEICLDFLAVAPADLPTLPEFPED